MKLFSCQSCAQVVFFESVTCTKCGHALGFDPDRAEMCALEPVSDPVEQPQPAPPRSSIDAVVPQPSGGGPPPSGAVVQFRAVSGDGTAGAIYRLCRNQTEHAGCNWLIPAGDAGDYCRSCRLNHIIPNLASVEAKQAWYRLESAKRRVLYTLFELDLAVDGKTDHPDSGLEFEFLQDSSAPGAPHVYTGHNDGVITINIAEADDPFREKMRVQMGEAYRTVLGHFRHEIGHYYWDVLIKGTPRLGAFRSLFDDEQADYALAQQQHYAGGPPADWPQRYVSAYASMHPWEDWAETWAHYLHIVDTLETARAFSLTLRPLRDEAIKAGALSLASRRINPHSFSDLIGGWVPLTVALNALNRSMGLNDVYPFVLSDLAIQKLRFVHETIEQARPPQG